jgi:DNA repair exonuclease SbcCD ATPase subunit
MKKDIDGEFDSSEEIKNRISILDREISVIEARERELSESIQKADERAKHLMDREKDILTVESRFGKIENLIGDLSERHRQALTLQKRIEELRHDSQISKEELEGLISEADEKFEKLSAFLDVVQNSMTTLPAIKSSKNPSNDPILERKKNTVLSLYEKHHWSPDSISDKLGIEKSLVDTILASRKVR